MNRVTWFYPVYKEIYCLHSYYAIPLTEGTCAFASRWNLIRKEYLIISTRYNTTTLRDKVFMMMPKHFVDFRPFLLPYTQHGFYNCRQYLPQSGKYYVDVACGPVAFKEYIQLAEGFECRICIDLSLNALLQAQRNLEAHGQPGIFICGDLTALPLKDGCGRCGNLPACIISCTKENAGTGAQRTGKNCGAWKKSCYCI